MGPNDRDQDQGDRDEDQGEGRSGDLYDSAMGDVHGGSVEFDKGGPGVDHHVEYGDGGHFSWDTDSDGDVSGEHGRDDTDHSTW